MALAVRPVRQRMKRNRANLILAHVVAAVAIPLSCFFVALASIEESDGRTACASLAGFCVLVIGLSTRYIIRSQGLRHLVLRNRYVQLYALLVLVVSLVCWQRLLFFLSFSASHRNNQQAALWQDMGIRYLPPQFLIRKAEEDERLRPYMLMWIGKQGSEVGTDYLAKIAEGQIVLENVSPQDVLVALASTQRLESLPLLGERLHSGDPVDRRLASYALRCSAIPEAIPVLIEGLNRENQRSSSECSIPSILENRTGKNFGDDYEKWKAWWSRAQPFFLVYDGRPMSDQHYLVAAKLAEDHGGPALALLLCMLISGESGLSDEIGYLEERIESDNPGLRRSLVSKLAAELGKDVGEAEVLVEYVRIHGKLPDSFVRDVTPPSEECVQRKRVLRLLRGAIRELREGLMQYQRERTPTGKNGDR